MKNYPKRLLLIENDGGMIRSVRAALEEDGAFQFIGYLPNRGNLETFLDTYAPDIALVDMGLMQPGSGLASRIESHSSQEGLEIISLIDSLSPHTIIIGFSDYFFEYPELAKDAMNRGADALIAKQNGPSDWEAWRKWLIAQLNSVIDGWWRPTPEVAKLLAEDEERRRSEALDDLQALTERQMEVLRLMAAGCSNKEIATKLSIEEGAVRGHIANIRKRLKLRRRHQIVYEARRLGISGALNV